MSVSRFAPLGSDFFKKKPVLDTDEMLRKKQRVQKARTRNNTKYKA